MKGKDLWKLSEAELKKEINISLEALFKLRFQKVVDELNDHNEIRHLRRKIARIKTIMRLREIEQAKLESAGATKD